MAALVTAVLYRDVDARDRFATRQRDLGARHRRRSDGRRWRACESHEPGCRCRGLPARHGRAAVWYSAKDYFGDYRVRSSAWLGGNLRGALEALIDLDARVHPAGIYFSTLQSTGGLMDTRNRWMDAYWKFYLIKHGRQELLNRSAPFNQTNPSKIAAGSLVLANVGDPTTESLVAAGQLKQLQLIPELGAPPFFAILQR